MRIRVILAIVLLLVVATAGWWFFGRGNSTAASFAAIVHTGPIACPPQPDDLSGIEGWAPAAGATEQTGTANVQSFGGLGGGLAGSAATATPAATCTGLSAAQSARFDWIDAHLGLVPTDGYDPAARAAEFTSIDAAFAFVRDKIHTEAYAGAMRGAGGTLQSRGGSPADKALLLAALLAAQNVEVRFVHAALGADDVQRLLAAATGPLPQQDEPNLDDAFRALGIDPSQARANLAGFRARSDAAADAVLSTSATGSAALVAILGTQRQALPAGDSAIRTMLAADVGDHWWLQANRNGSWIDLDPTLPQASMGDHLGPAPQDAPVAALPDSVYATITVQLIADRMTSGTMVSAPLVTRTFRSSDAYALPVFVTIGDRTKGMQQLATSISFTPSIGVDGNDVTGDAFTTDGLARVRLEIETVMADGTKHDVVRSVVDRRGAGGTSIDPAWTPERTAYALTDAYSIVPLGGELDPGFVGKEEGAAMHALRAFMAYAAAGGNGRQTPPVGSGSYPVAALRFYTYDALLRHRLEDASNGAVRFTFDHPMLSIQRIGFALVNGRVVGTQAFDIADNGMIPIGPNGARANMTRGYADTFAEQHMFAGNADGGTIAVFDAARRANVPIQVFVGQKYGGTAIGPAHAILLNGSERTGWWQVDMATGSMVGRMDDGAGQELTEYAVARMNDWSTLYSMIQFYGDFFRCIAGAVESPLAGDQAHAQQWFQGCAGQAICNYLEALGSGEAFSRWGSDAEALLYNILDVSAPGTKDALPPAGGAACSAIKSPLYP